MLVIVKEQLSKCLVSNFQTSRISKKVLHRRENLHESSRLFQNLFEIEFV